MLTTAVPDNGLLLYVNSAFRPSGVGKSSTGWG